MSPASSGTLEVEKYIGACLISQSRPKAPINSTRADVFFSRLPDSYANFDGRFRLQRCNSVDRWAGGMPLISFANHQKRNRRPPEQERSCSPSQEQHNPLARLAVHTQGAPLILAKTFNNRRNKSQKNQSNRCFDNKKSQTNNKSVESQNSSVGVDAVSVTSDESSGSANSDNCLPRIIKPRKRRKKDRKPTLLGRSLNQDEFSTDSASPDIDTIPVSALRPYTPFIFDPHIYGLVPETLPLSKPNENEFYNNESETPQLHHSFEDVEELDDAVDINGNQTLCQCRYCDPAGQIWDVDRNCYSPFLTAPIRGKNFQFANFDSVLPTLVHSMSSVSLDEEKDQKNDSKALRVSSGDLEVSTEIVTSLNGHRDIEIKFFSSSSVDNVRTLPKGPDEKVCAVKNLCDDVNSECNFFSEE